MNIQRALEGAGDLSVHPSVSALHIPASHAFIPFQHFSGISAAVPPESVVSRSRPDDNNNKTVVSVVAAVSGLCPALPVVSMQHQPPLGQAVIATPAIVPAVVAPVAVQTAAGAFAPPGSGPSDMGNGLSIAATQQPSVASAAGIALACSLGNPVAVNGDNIAAVAAAAAAAAAVGGSSTNGNNGNGGQKSSPTNSPTVSNKSIIAGGNLNLQQQHVKSSSSGSNSSSGGQIQTPKSGKMSSSSAGSNNAPNAKIPSVGNSSSSSSSSSSHNLTQEQTDDLVKPVFKDGELVLEVECGQNKGILYLSKLCQGSKGPCISFQSSWLTPNEFQFVSGRETAKDWKRSIRHHGKSLKLLLAKGILNVHPTMCDCDGCRQGATLTRKGEKRRIPNGERKIRKPINNNNSNGSSSSSSSSSNGNSNTNINGNNNNNNNATSSSSSNNHHSSSSNSAKGPVSGGPDKPPSVGPFRPIGGLIVPGQLSPGGAPAKPEAKRAGVDKASKVADRDTLVRYPTDLSTTSTPVFPTTTKACLLPIPPHGLMVNTNLASQGLSSHSSSAMFSPIKISPTNSASSSSSSSSPSPNSFTSAQPLPLALPTVPLPFSSAASSLLFSSALKPNQLLPHAVHTSGQNGDAEEGSPSNSATNLSQRPHEGVEVEASSGKFVSSSAIHRDSCSPDSDKVNELDRQSCDEEDDEQEEESSSDLHPKDGGDKMEIEDPAADVKARENDEPASDVEDCFETNAEDVAKSDVSFDSSDEEGDEPEKLKEQLQLRPESKSNVQETEETKNKDMVEIKEENLSHDKVSEDDQVIESNSKSPSLSNKDDANVSAASPPPMTYSSPVPSQPSLPVLTSQTTVKSSATMSVSALTGTCSQTSATAPNNVKSEHIWVPPTLATPVSETDKMPQSSSTSTSSSSSSSSSLSSSFSVKSEDHPTPAGAASRAVVQHPVNSTPQAESKPSSLSREAPIQHKPYRESEFNFRSVSDLCAPVKRESADAKLLSPPSSSSSSSSFSSSSSSHGDRRRDREREEHRQRQRMREERNRKDREREERREKERREERERESERRRAEERREQARSQSDAGSKHDPTPHSVTPALTPHDPLRRPPGGASEAAAFSDYMRVLAASHGNAFLPPNPAAYMQPMLSLRPPDPRMASQLLSPLAAASYTSSLAAAGLPKDPLMYPGTSSMLTGLTHPGIPPAIHPFLQRPALAPTQSSMLDYQRSLASATASAYPWPSPFSYLLPDLGAASSVAAAAAAASASLKRQNPDLDAAMDLNAKRMRLEGRSTELGSHWDYLAAAAAAQRPQIPTLPCGLESANVDKTTEYLRKRYMEYGPQAAAYLSALPEYARTMYHCACAEHRDEDIRLWNVEDVCKFLNSLDGCAVYADHFREQRVDGRILALLSTDHLMKTLGMKLGPAVLLYEAVAKKLQDISKMSNCEACRSIAMSQPMPPMALPL